MKLWQKIFLSSLALLAVVTNGLSLVFLYNTQEQLWQREAQRAAVQQQNMMNAIKTTVINQRLQSGQICLPETETTDAAASALSSQEAGSYLLAFQLYSGARMLTTDDTGLCAAADIVSEEQSDAGLTYTRSFRQGEQLLLALNCPLPLEQQNYRLVCVFDVTSLDQQLKSQAFTALALGILVSVAAAGLLLLVVKVQLRPLDQLSQASRRIAAGNYGERVQLRGSDELTDLGQDMNRMAQAVQSHVGQLEQAAEDQKTFIANMAHEMKTPLTSILGFADLLYIQKEVPEKKRMEYAGIIVEETKRMRSLSSKLMELLNVGSQNLIFTSERLASVLNEVAAAMQPVLNSSGMALQYGCEPDLYLLMDRELFKSLLYNFIDNGRKASPEGSLIKLLARRQGNKAEILIRDYGQGIPKKELKKIRQPFYMVDKSRSRKAGGAGLGLALCEEIARIHKGSFDIDSRVDQGTLITLRFPLAQPDTPSQPAVKEEPHEDTTRS